MSSYIENRKNIWYNEHRMAKSIEDSIDFAAKRQIWQRMILRIIRAMFIIIACTS